MDENQIDHLRKIYNKEHLEEKQIKKGSAKKVWGEIVRRLHHKCKEKASQCIVNSLLKHPKAPKEWESNPKEWLSSIEIDQLETNLMDVFPNYAYLGTIPIDFDKKSSLGACLVDALCSISIVNLYNKGKTQIGIVFNTDVSTGPGQHWIALFADIRPTLEYPRITYFDSYANKPEPEIQRLMQRWKSEWDATNIHKRKTKLTYNKTRHQYEDSECGMYSLLFHIYSLAGADMSERIPDDVVRRVMRRLIFDKDINNGR